MIGVVLIGAVGTVIFLGRGNPAGVDDINIDQPMEIERVYHGLAPDCPERYCISVVVNGDLLFHPGLWDNFRTGDEREFDFASLFAAQKPYLEKTDVAICNLETPIANPGGPYAGYPIFNIPPHVVDAVAEVGYDACTAATNHAIDQGVAGIERVIDKLDSLNIKHTGIYKTAEDSQKPLILDTEGGKIAVIGGTVSLNGMVADQDWRVDRLRDGEMMMQDVERAANMARKAREQGANIVIMQLHSLQEYITYADGWQQSAAHALIDTGEFDMVYFHGSHSVQPLEIYNDVYIIYGLGNSQTVSAPESRYVNNQGLTVRMQFSSPDQENWQVSKLSYLPTFNKTGARYAWCPLATDHPSGFCLSESGDAQMLNRMENILFSMNVNRDNPVAKLWLITEEQNGQSAN